MIVIKDIVKNGRLPENVRKQISELLPGYNDEEVVITIQGSEEVENTIFKVVPFNELAAFALEFKEALEIPYHNMTESEKYAHAIHIEGYKTTAGFYDAQAAWYLGMRKNQIFTEISLEDFSKMSATSQKEYLMAKSASLNSFCKLIRNMIESADTKIRLIISVNSYAKAQQQHAT